tara:strand:+ start:100 stop:456 length:357 start_codon:yes stop_codon:yes gene_type:complete
MNLTVEKAKELVTFIDTTNYQVATLGEDPFPSLEVALDFISSSRFDPIDGLELLFDVEAVGHNDWAKPYYENGNWFIVDSSMGGVEANAPTLKQAIIAYREAHDDGDPLQPVSLVIHR